METQWDKDEPGSPVDRTESPYRTGMRDREMVAMGMKARAGFQRSAPPHLMGRNTQPGVHIGF